MDQAFQMYGRLSEVANSKVPIPANERLRISLYLDRLNLVPTFEATYQYMITDWQGDEKQETQAGLIAVDYMVQMVQSMASVSANGS